MKWSIVGLIAVGLVAAASAAMLVAALRSTPSAQGAQAAAPVDVLVAARPLAAMSLVDSQSVVLRKMLPSAVPLEAMSDPVAVVGKVVRLPMIEGQVFTPASLAAKDSGISLAATVREGMRAVSLSLSDYEAMEGLLYPGGVVDVLFSFRAPPGSRSQSEETISTTLLKAVQVLAIEGRTILSAVEGAATPAASAVHGGRKQIVTLMVTPKQAELLQLAQEHGAISLAMRNPLEPLCAVNEEEVRSQLSEFFRRHSSEPAPPPAVAEAPASMPAAEPKASATPAPKWNVTFIRGGASETQSFPMPEAKP